VYLVAQLAVVSAAENFDGVREQRGDNVEGFDSTFGAAGQVDDDGLVAENGDAAGQQGHGRFLGAAAADFFGKAGDGAVGDVEGRLGGIVARAEAGASGGEEHIGVAGIGDGAKLAADFGRVVGTSQGRVDLPAKFAATLDESGAGEVFAFAAGHGVADGEDRDAHFSVVSRKF